MKLLSILLLFCTCCVFCAPDIAASGQIAVTSTPYQAAVFVPKIDNSYAILGLNTIKYNQPAMKLTTSISKQNINNTNDKLTITAAVMGAVGLTYQL